MRDRRRPPRQPRRARPHLRRPRTHLAHRCRGRGTRHVLQIVPSAAPGEDDQPLYCAGPAEVSDAANQSATTPGRQVLHISLSAPGAPARNERGEDERVGGRRAAVDNGGRGSVAPGGGPGVRAVDPGPDRHPPPGGCRRQDRIRTIPGPTTPTSHTRPLSVQVSDASHLYHQQTKSLLVSYPAKKPGFFQRTHERAPDQLFRTSHGPDPRTHPSGAVPGLTRSRSRMDFSMRQLACSRPRPGTPPSAAAHFRRSPSAALSNTSTRRDAASGLPNERAASAIAFRRC